MKKKRSFLNSECPFTLLEERVTWGEFIATYAKAAIGALCFYGYYILIVACADMVGVIE